MKRKVTVTSETYPISCPVGEKANVEVREAILKSGLKQWQVAQMLGVHEGTFSRMLRMELSPDMKEKILDTISEKK